jgi:hypothetical protein
MSRIDQIKENIKIDDDVLELIELQISDINLISNMNHESFLKLQGKIELLMFLKQINNKNRNR